MPANISNVAWKNQDQLLLPHNLILNYQIINILKSFHHGSIHKLGGLLLWQLLFSVVFQSQTGVHFIKLFVQYGSCYVIQDSFTPKILRNFHFGIRLSSHKLSIHFLSAELILNCQLTIGNIRDFTELTIVAIWSDINPNLPIKGYYRWLLPCITCLCTPSMGGTNLFC